MIASPSPGAASHLSTACSAFPPMTASTPRIIQLPCPTTSPRAPSRTMCVTVLTSTRTSLSFLLLPWLATQVGACPYLCSLCVRVAVGGLSGKHCANSQRLESASFCLRGVGRRRLYEVWLVSQATLFVNSHWLLEANSPFYPKGSFPSVVGEAYILDIFPYLRERNYINLVFLEALPGGQASRDFF